MLPTHNNTYTAQQHTLHNNAYPTQQHPLLEQHPLLKTTPPPRTTPYPYRNAMHFTPCPIFPPLRGPLHQPICPGQVTPRENLKPLWKDIYNCIVPPVFGNNTSIVSGGCGGDPCMCCIGRCGGDGGAHSSLYMHHIYSVCSHFFLYMHHISICFICNALVTIFPPYIHCVCTVRGCSVAYDTCWPLWSTQNTSTCVLVLLTKNKVHSMVVVSSYEGFMVVVVLVIGVMGEWSLCSYVFHGVLLMEIGGCAQCEKIVFNHSPISLLLETSENMPSDNQSWEGETGYALALCIPQPPSMKQTLVTTSTTHLHDVVYEFWQSHWVCVIYVVNNQGCFFY